MVAKRETETGAPSETAEALRWYLRWLLVRELDAKILTQADIARRMGIAESMLSQLRSDVRGAGMKMLDYFSAYFRKSQDEMMAEARAWWGKPEWRQWAKDELDKINKRKHARLEGRARERRTISSERPSVKLSVAPPVAAEGGKKK